MAIEWSGGGDAVRAVDALFRAEARTLVGMLTAYVGDRALAEDLAQEAFARVQHGWGRIREPDRAVSYLRATAFNLARSALRRRRVFGPMIDLVSSATPEDQLLVDEQHNVVLAAVSHLPTRQRACVILRYYAELGIEEIAETLSISPNSVKTHLVRGLDALEKRLEDSR